MKKTIRFIGCLMPHYTLFHCVLFVLAFSHFISSPTARAVMNEYVNYEFVSKISLQLTTKDTMPEPASSMHAAFYSDMPVSPDRAGFCWYAAEHCFVKSPRVKQLSTERLLL